MKQFIVLLAVLPLLMLFVLQFSVQEQRLYRISRAEEITEVACEQAKLDGYFTEQNRAALAESLGNIFGLSAEAVEIHSPWEIHYRTNDPLQTIKRGMIDYEIKVPLDQIVAGSSLLGISPEQNKGTYVMAGQLPSERLMP